MTDIDPSARKALGSTGLTLQQARWVHAALVAAAVTALCWVGSASTLFDGLGTQAEDLLQPGTDAVGEVIVVGIDRTTFQQVGESWPWPRTVHAELMQQISAGEPRAVVYDVVFADPGMGDAALEAAISAVPTVLASAVSLQRRDGIPVVVDAVEPLERFVRRAVDVGHANVSVVEQRGVVRSIPFYALDDRGVVVPSLTAAAIAVEQDTSSYIERPDGLQIGDRLVPLDSGELRINYADDLVDIASPLSAARVLRGEVDPAEFEDRIVVVGVTEPTIGDLHLIPPDKSGSVSGVLIHANAINAVLGRAWLAPAATPSQWVLISAASVLTSAGFLVFRLRVAAIVAASTIAGIVAWSAWRFSTAGELWDIVWPSFAVIAAAGTMTVYRYLTEIRFRRRAEAMFGEYVPDNIVTDLADPERLNEALEGRRIEAVMLFCDLRGFTPVAAELRAEQVRLLLDTYYGYVSRIVLAHHGTVMQFVGDEVFAVFGAPLPVKTYRADALAAAVQLVDGVERLDEQLDKQGLPPVRFGVGLHRGVVVAAHVGTPAHRQYTVVGDPVNVGSRLCGEAGVNEVVVSAVVFDGERPPTYTLIGELELKGVKRPIEAFRRRDVYGATGGRPRLG